MIKKIIMLINNNLNSKIKSLPKFDDAFYLLDLQKLKEEFLWFRDTFANKNTLIAYSYKTNYLKDLIKSLTNMGAYSEVVSPFEVEITKEYNINPSKIIYNGPVKNFKSIKYVLEGEGLVNADSFDDLKLILNTMQNCNLTKSPRIGIRFSFEEDILNSRFGIEYNDANFSKIISLLNGANINFPSCFHIHFPQRDLNSLKLRLEKLKTIFYKHFNEINQKPFFLDIGGGFPSRMPKSIMNSLNIKNIDFNDYKKIMSNFYSNLNKSDINYIVEPGTAIVANSLSLIANISTINKKSYATFINSDFSKNLIGGINKDISYPIYFLNSNKPKGKKFILEKSQDLFLGGYTCVENDFIKLQLKSSTEIFENSKIIISAIGSYSNVFKSPFIRGDIPLYIWDGEEIFLSKYAQSVKDLLNYVE